MGKPDFLRLPLPCFRTHLAKIRRLCYISPKLDGFVKGPSAALRLIPGFSPALHFRLFTKPLLSRLLAISS
jgi:hypothetical protein